MLWERDLIVVLVFPVIQPGRGREESFLVQADRVFVRFWNSRAVQPQPFRCFDSSAEAGLVHSIPAWQMAWVQLVEGLMLLLLG